MKPAARLSDLYLHPVLGPMPIIMGVPTVMIENLPAATLTSAIAPGGIVAMGSTKVLIGGKPAARIGDPTIFGPIIKAGIKVLIGG